MRLPLPQFSSENRHPGYIAEVIETTTPEFLAQCLEPDDLNFATMPPFGSWVKAKDEDAGHQIFAVVYHVTTSPIDSVHRARALGLSLQELRDQQPQIFAMLKTEFRAAIVGYQPAQISENGAGRKTSLKPMIYQHLPPRPPQVHQAVYYCEPEEVIQFSEQLDFLRTLLQVNGAPVESLTAAALREIYRLRKADQDWLVQAGRALSILLKDDYDRLRIILGQVHL